MPSLRFHTKYHGDHIEVSTDGTTALRVRSGRLKGMVFSDRPVHIDEKVCVRLKIPWNGEIRFGFTSQDPAKKSRSIAQHWAVYIVYLEKDYAKKENILYYHVNSSGQVYYGVDGEDKGWLFSGVPVQCPLWAFMEIHCHGTTVQFVDSKALNQALIQSLLENADCVQSVPEKNVVKARSMKLGGDRFGEGDAARVGSATNVTSLVVGVTTDVARRVVGVTSDAASRIVGVTTDVASRDVGVTTDAASRDVGVTTHAASRDVGVTTDVASQDVGVTTDAASRYVGVTSTAGRGGAVTMARRKLSPLSFHNVHGNALRISNNGSVAERMQPGGIEDGDAYSARPVTVNEKVCLRFVNISCDRKATIHFGFTARDPATLSNSVPKRQRKLWVWPLAKKFQQKNNTMYYNVDAFGEVFLVVNGEQKGVFFCNVDTTSPVWAIVQINGVGTAVQFRDASDARNTGPIQSLEESLIGGIQPLPIEVPLTYQGTLIPLSLHTTKGRNVQLCSEFATRIQGTFSQGYLFTAHPMHPSQTIVIQILSVLAPAGRRPGGLAFGLTSCDPAKLRQCDLTDDADKLLVRQEYWVVNSNFAEALCKGDELAITLTQNGEVQESRNSSEPRTVMHVDHTLKLWAFVDLYETTQRVRMMTTHPVATRPQQSRVQEAALDSRERPSTSRQQPRREHSTPAAVGRGQESADTECSICFDRQVDCALYKCGHVCMCYTCAVRWKDGGGRCPICRAQIMEVMRLFRS